MLTKGQADLAKNALTDYLLEHYNTDVSGATNRQLYVALASVAKKFLYENRKKTYTEANKNKKAIHYMSIEFLLGKNLKNNLWNLEIETVLSDFLEAQGKNIQNVYDVEKDAGLGNGGLGRLASCFLDSLATLKYPAFGHSIKYEYGLFNQKIVGGKQIETPDEWLDTGMVWLEPREDQAVDVIVGGTITEHYSEYGMNYEYHNATVIKALPFDMMISGYGSNTVSTLRLWEAKAKNKFDIKRFDNSEYVEATREKTEIEAINKVLYPSDGTEKGKDLRLLQQYFLVSASMQNIVNNFFKNHKKAYHLPKYVSVHINDTHPAMCIPELMRILMDNHGIGWDEAWKITKQTISYTNHTILSEALEVKRMHAMERMLPRIAMIIREIDRRLRVELNEFFKNDYRKIESMAVVSGNNVYMANLAICASHTVNGVAKIHSHILKTKLFKDYAEMYNGRFKNITNGVTHRRWLCESNPELNKLITGLIGDGFYDKPEELEKLAEFANDSAVLAKLGEVKLHNKIRFAKYLEQKQGIVVDPRARFDVQVKRIHEYKRQLLNVLKIIYLCEKIKENPAEYVTPQVFIFGGKAASGYVMAKRIIKLINQVAAEVNNDPVIAGRIKVVFVENYSVTVSELLMPATEVSEQISLAGREASGTGNMKAVLNGSLMLCTIDGANIEICDHCGHENMFEFGLTAEEVEKIKQRGYNAMEYYIGNECVRRVIDKLNVGVNGESFADIADYLLGHSDYKDSYMCLADFMSYLEAHYNMDREYADQENWNQKSLKSIAAMGYFSSDRSIEEYAQKIWSLSKNEE